MLLGKISSCRLGLTSPIAVLVTVRSHQSNINIVKDVKDSKKK